MLDLENDVLFPANLSKILLRILRYIGALLNKKIMMIRILFDISLIMNRVCQK